MSCQKVLFFTFAFVVRLIVTGIGEYIDRNSYNLKYTDVDYNVFSDAATYVFKGQSPYKRHTYRYTPLAAYICLVNNYIHPVCGKIVFCIADIIMGIILWKIFDTINFRNKSHNKYYVAFWVLNPLVINMSTRGSNDNLISCLVFISVYFILKKQYIIGGLFYGLSVHFKIYPIIYAIPFYLFIDCDFSLIERGRKWEAFKKNLISKNKIIFTLFSAGTFIALTYYFYVLYGYEFLYEAYLYHFERKDHRHNFSIYWHLIYQIYDMPNSTVIGVMTFLPQWGLSAIAGLCFYYDLFFAMFLQTVIFVNFNKVITAQYFLWYMTILPLILVNNDIMKCKFLCAFIAVMYVVVNVAWGSQAYNFEMMGLHSLREIQYANQLFFWYVVFSLYHLIMNHRLTITKQICPIEDSRGEGKSKTE